MNSNNIDYSELNEKKEIQEQNAEPISLESIKEELHDYEINGKIYKKVIRRNDGVSYIAFDENNNWNLSTPYEDGKYIKRDGLSMPIYLHDAKLKLLFYDVGRDEKTKEEFIDILKFATQIALTPEEKRNLIDTTEQWINAGGIASKMATEIRNITNLKKAEIDLETKTSTLFLRDLMVFEREINKNISQYVNGENIINGKSDRYEYDLLKEMEKFINEKKESIDSKYISVGISTYNKLYRIANEAKRKQIINEPIDDKDFKYKVSNYVKYANDILNSYGNKQLKTYDKEELQFIVHSLSKMMDDSSNVSEEVKNELRDSINSVIENFEQIQKKAEISPQVEYFDMIYKKLKEDINEYSYLRKKGINSDSVEQMQDEVRKTQNALVDVYNYMEQNEYNKYSDELDDIKAYFDKEMQTIEDFKNEFKSL